MSVEIREHRPGKGFVAFHHDPSSASSTASTINRSLAP
jgi:hypothetical protein